MRAASVSLTPFRGRMRYRTLRMGGTARAVSRRGKLDALTGGRLENRGLHTTQEELLPGFVRQPEKAAEIVGRHVSAGDPCLFEGSLTLRPR